MIALKATDIEMSLPKSFTKDPKVVGRSTGVDLGISNSCIAILTSAGVAEVIPNAEGERTTPS